MKPATTIFNDWAINNKDEGMEKSHSSAVMDMLQYSLSLIKTPFSFIDAGCGNGWVVRYMTKQSLCKNAIGVDGALEMINKAKRLDNIGEYVLSDLLNYIPLKKVELVLSMEVFYYFSNPSHLASHIIGNWLASESRLIIGIDYFKENVKCHNWPEQVGTPMKMLSRLDWVDIFLSTGLKDIHHWLSSSKENPIGTLIITGTNS